MPGSLGEAVLDLRGDSSGLRKDVDSAGNLTESRLQAIGDRMTALGSTLTRSLTLPLVGIGVAAGKMSMDFETSMQHIVGLVGISQKQVDAWSQQLLKLGPEVGKSPRELAEALYFVASSGIETGKAIDVVVAAAKAASAGLGDTQVVADAVSSALNAYAKSGLTAGKATGILVAAVREGKGEANEIAPALGRVIPIAAQLGISFDQVGATLASMTLVGFDAAESATNLSGIMSAMLKPSSQARDILSSVGLSAEGLRKQIREEGLLAALNTLRVKIGDDDEALAAIFPNIRGFRGLLSLTGENADKTADIFKKLAGTTEEDLNQAFAAVTETGAFKFQQAMAQVQDLLINLGNAIMPVVLPILKDLTATVKSLADGFAKLPDPVKRGIVIAAALAAALGPVLLIGGQLVTAVAAIAGVLSGPLVLAIGAAIAAAVAIAQNWDTIWPQIQSTVEGVVAGIREAWERFGPPILRIIHSVMDSIQSIITTVLNAVRSFIEKHGEEIRTFFQNAWQRVQDIIGGVLEIIQATVVPVLQAIAQFVSEHGAEIEAALTAAWNAIRTVVDTVLATIQSVVRAVLAALRGDWEGAWNEIKGAAERIWNGLAASWNTFWTVTIPAVWNAFKEAFPALWDQFWGTTLPAAWTAFKQLFQMAWDQFWGTTVPAAWESFKQLFQIAWDAFWGTILPAAWESFKQLFQMAWDQFWGTTLPKAFELFKRGLEFAWNQFWSVTMPATWEAFKKLLSFSWENFWQILPKAWEQFKQLIQTAWDTLWGTIVPWIFRTFVNKLQADWNTFWGTTLPNAFEAFKAFLATLPERFLQVGKDIINGIVEGIKQFGPRVLEALGNVVRDAIQSIKERLGIASPSTVFAAFGAQMMAGLAQGIAGANLMPRLALQDATSDLVARASAMIDLSAPDVSAARLNPTTASAGNTANYYLTAQYAMQDERSLSDDIRLLQMLGG